jgi:hypothetical protein
MTRGVRSGLPLDPLLAALIGRLPTPGSPAMNSGWAAASRVNWLRMMAMAFDSIYGPSGGDILVVDALNERDWPMESRVARAAPHGAAGPGAEKPVMPPSPAGEPSAPVTSAAETPSSKRPNGVRPHFYIDRDGYARRYPGDERVTASEAAGWVIYDRRGEAGDLASIVWGDGRQGVLGLQVEISGGAPE